MSDAAPIGDGLRIAGPTGAIAPRELFVRYARRDGRSIAVLRALDQGDSCLVEAEVFPAGSAQGLRPGPYSFASAQEATTFVTEAVEALMYLGCDIAAS
jgi:hypothetical protein